MFNQIAPFSIVLSWFTGVYVDLKNSRVLKGGGCSRGGGNWGTLRIPFGQIGEP